MVCGSRWEGSALAGTRNPQSVPSPSVHHTRRRTRGWGKKGVVGTGGGRAKVGKGGQEGLQQTQDKKSR